MTLGQDLHFALRMLHRTPGFTAAAVFTIALGICSTTAIFTVVNGVLLRPLPYREPKRLVKLWEQSPEFGFDQQPVTPADYSDWRHADTLFEELACYPGWSGSGTFLVPDARGSERVEGTFVSANIFRTLGVEPLLGRGFTAEEESNGEGRVVVLSEGLWQRRFGGDPNVLGRTLTLDSYSRRDYTVVGVMPKGFRFPENAELWLPLGLSDFPRTSRSGHWLQVLGRLKPGATLAQARSEMHAIQQRLAGQFPDARIGSRVKVTPLLEEVVGDARLALWTLLAAVGLVLLIACANVANLLLARAAARQAELSIRAALGASRGRLVLQLLTESVMLAGIGGVAGGAAGILAAQWGTQSLTSGFSLPRVQEVLSVDYRVLAFAVIVSMATGILFGLAPALHMVRPKAAGGARRTRAGLVVCEIALTTMLVAVSLTMIESLLRLERVNPGFRSSNALVANLDLSSSRYSTSAAPGPNRPQAFLQRLMERLRNITEVEAVGAAGELPLAGSESSGDALTVDTVSGLKRTGKVDTRVVTPGYFRAMMIPLIAGRDFTGADTDGAPNVVVINEEMARRYWPGENPVGKRILRGIPESAGPRQSGREIVGVVGNVRHAGLAAGPMPELYVPYFQFSMRSATLVMRTRASLPSGLAPALRAEVQALNSYTPLYRIRSLEQVVADSVALPRLRSRVLALFAAVAVLLAAVGIYGVLSYLVTQRSREIAIRMALGAEARSIQNAVLGQGLLWTLTGVAIGLAAAGIVSTMLAHVLFGVGGSDPTAMGAAAVFLIGVALAASWLPARRAAMADPMRALRHQ
jgi:putative ABC transport system permease protein